MMESTPTAADLMHDTRQLPKRATQAAAAPADAGPTVDARRPEVVVGGTILVPGRPTIFT